MSDLSFVTRDVLDDDDIRGRLRQLVANAKVGNSLSDNELNELIFKLEGGLKEHNLKLSLNEFQDWVMELQKQAWVSGELTENFMALKRARAGR